MSLLGHILSSQALPQAVATALQLSAGDPSAPPQGGFAGLSHCWVLAQGQLFIWNHEEGVNARILTVYPPSQLTRTGQCFISVIVTTPGSTTVVVANSAGMVAAWPGVEYNSEPVYHQITQLPTSAHVSAATAVAPALATGVSFTVTLGCSDGSVFLIWGGQQSLQERLLVQGHDQRHSGGGAASDQRSLGSVMGKVGSVVGKVITDAFAPLAKFTKKEPSGQPVRAVHARMLDVAHVHVYALTDDTLDCWKVTSSLRAVEEFAWSAQTVMAAEQGRKLRHAKNKAMTICDDVAYVVMEGTDQGHRESTWLHKVSLRGEVPNHFDCAEIPDGKQGEQGSPVRMSDLVHSLAVTVHPQAALILTNQHTLYEYLPSDTTHVSVGSKRPRQAAAAAPAQLALVSAEPDTLAVAAVPGAERPPSRAPSESGAAGGSAGSVGAAAPRGAGGAWLVLNVVYGVMQLSAGSAAVAEQGALAPITSMRAAVDFGTDQQERVCQNIDNMLGQAEGYKVANQPLRTLAMSLRSRLLELGALASVPNSQVLAAYSTAMVDALPKQWSLGVAGQQQIGVAGGRGATHAVTLKGLTDKESKQTLFMQMLFEGGVLPALPPAVLRALAENSEKLAAADTLLSLHTQAVESSAGALTGTELQLRPGASDADTLRDPTLIPQVIAAAGARIGDKSTTQEPLPPAELFYARPSASLPALLQAMGDAARDIRRQTQTGLGGPEDAGTRTLLARVITLGNMLGVVFATVTEHRQRLRDTYGVSVEDLCVKLDSPSWWEDRSARDAVDSVTLACQAVRQLLLPASRAQALPELLTLARITLGCVEILLGMYEATMAATQNEDDQRQLLADYQGARNRCLANLLHDAVLTSDPSLPLTSDALMLSVLTLSAQHHCYNTLFDACERVDSWAGASPESTLHTHMASVVAEKGDSPSSTFARYCFKRLLRDKRTGDLLELPRRFWKDLSHWLQQQPGCAELLWILLGQMGEYKTATQAIELDAETKNANYKEQRNLLAFEHLMSQLTGDPSTTSRIEGRLRLSNVQEQLLRLSEARGGLPGLGQASMDCVALVDCALSAEKLDKSGQGALLALEALGSAPPTVLQANRQKLQSTWSDLVSATSWKELRDAHGSGATATQAFTDSLSKTPLCQAVRLSRQVGLFKSHGQVTDTQPQQEVQGWIEQWTQKDRVARECAMQAFQLGLSSA